DAQIGALDQRFRSGASFDKILHAQDAGVLKALGVSSTGRARLYGAWDRLRSRRQRTLESPSEAA
ncbi:MAG TPA: hypothetical protein VEA99_09025, partial [Gemmatimonadaceae bacterium]|nr:hypothetical protein [Gemmatimonadaceae bacterium]